MSLEPAPSYWLTHSATTNYPRLAARTHVDVAVIGAGMAGITTALLLKRAGRSVALIEAARAAEQISGHTTAKITSLHRLIYAELNDSAGDEVARLYGESQQAALRTIVGLIEDHKIDCSFERAPAYTYCTDIAHLDAVRREAEIAARLGLPAQFTAESPLPFDFVGAVRFADQAQFHPRSYLLELLRQIPGDGSHVFERSRVLDITEDEPCRVTTADETLTADHVVVTTGMPILDRGGHFTAAHPYAHVAMAARLPEDAAFEGMFLSVEAPSRSVRIHRDEDGPVLIATGAKFKTGEADPLDLQAELEAWVGKHFPVQKVIARWWNQDFHAMDRRPYIGRVRSSTPRLWTATGFSAWGMTGGTLAGMILTDRICNVTNPWAGIYDSTRVNFAGAGKFLEENLDVARAWAGDRLGRRDRRTPAMLRPGEAAILRPASEAIAAYRRDDASYYAVSANCTHMGCRVRWNPLAKSWDCPCHGSRFAPDGAVLSGPAVKPLQRLNY